ncbi:hypothetical protein [Stenotrophomonas sp. PS02298]|uniref:hypothetical protein n=1 Tax=Stenotrophomonas sp. PS02298 TaxID=2991424 RepID=UPI00249BBC5F|nr:hypothetical protein [Stenotrophomonas sp. PS02298]
MKIRSAFLGAAVLVALTACDKGPATDAAPAEPAPASETAKDAAAAPAQNYNGVKVAGQVPLNFPHDVRSNSEATAEGVVTHTLRVEYKEVNEAAVAEALEKAFVEAGFKVQADGMKFVAVGESGKVRYAISPAGPELKVALASPDSKGMVTFIW